MRSDRRVPVAIVGGGFSGTILAAQLARRGIANMLIDGGRIGRGVAYSTSESAHLLNVCAEGMSAWSGDPDHFTRWFEAQGGDAAGYAQRRQFGLYVGEILDEAVTSGLTELVHVGAASAKWRDGGWTLTLADNSVVDADALALAVGNQQPETIASLSGAGDRLIGNPWGEKTRAAVANLAATGGSALLVGTGLTMVDLLLSLDAAGHRGPIVALSRRGLVPRSHAEIEPADVDARQVPHGSVRALARWLRKRSAAVGWRAAVDSLRPHSHALWQSLGIEEQRRFLRHARPWWDVHRHRIAPEIAQVVARAVAEGRLQVVAGRILSARAAGQGVEVEFRRRGANRSQAETFDYVFNCTGPLHAVARTQDPLLRGMLNDQLVRPEPLGIGIDTDERSRAGERLWALGPLTKGRYWEIVAVPDIREQAARVADDIERELSE